MVSIRRRAFLQSACATCAALAVAASRSAIAQTATDIRGPGYHLRCVGAQRETVMMGKREGVIDLQTLKHLPGLCAIGPIEGLSGEVTIIDGRPSLARVGTGNGPIVTESFEARAPFLVWAEVTGVWRAQLTPDTVHTLRDLESFIARAGAEAGLTEAFPFKLISAASAVQYHIVDAKPGHPPGISAHGTIQVKFDISQREILIVGFHSKRHHGIFTHMNSDMHLHFMTPDNTLSGHIDDIWRMGSLTLLLPSLG
jgi:acetolactate decarboxylase